MVIFAQEFDNFCLQLLKELINLLKHGTKVKVLLEVHDRRSHYEVQNSLNLPIDDMVTRIRNSDIISASRSDINTDSLGYSFSSQQSALAHK